MKNAKEHEDSVEEPVSEPIIWDPRCSTCKRKDRKAIEDAILAYEPVPHIAEAFKSTTPAIIRHARHSGLWQKRLDNWKGALMQVVSLGMKQRHIKISERGLIAAARVLAEIDGKIPVAGTTVVNNIAVGSPNMADRPEDERDAIRHTIAKVYDFGTADRF